MNQPLAALKYADEVRCGRAKLKREMKAGKVTLSEALDHPYAQSMMIFKLLPALPGVGEVKTTGVLRRTGVRSRAKVEDLTDHEREKLLRWFGIKPSTNSIDELSRKAGERRRAEERRKAGLRDPFKKDKPEPGRARPRPKGRKPTSLGGSHS